MTSDPVRSPSSIPDEIVRAGSSNGRRCSDNLARNVLEAAEPKLYAHWAEGRVEAVAEAMYEAAVDARRFEAGPGGVRAKPWAEINAVARAHWIELARAALGLEDRT